MSKKNKLQRFADLREMPNVFENMSDTEPYLIRMGERMGDMRGQWHTYFGNPKPLVLELACGKAEYSRALAQDEPDKNYIAIDIKGNRIWVGARDAAQRQLHNVAFLRTRIEQLPHFFAPQEIEQIWILFADPQLGKAKKRLTAPIFLQRYRQILAEQHLIHLKTDSPELYEYTLQVIEEEGLQLHYQRDDIYSQPLDFPALRHHTYYEEMHLKNNKTIKYIRFSLPEGYSAKNLKK